MRKILSLILVAMGSSLFLGAAFGSSPMPLKAGPAEELQKPGYFDYMEVDPIHDRLLAAHTEAGALVVFDLRHRKLGSSIPLGHVRGVAIEAKARLYILGDDDEKKLVLVNPNSLSIAGEVALPASVDAIAVDSRRGRAYADEDLGSHVWVVDLRTRLLIATIAVPGDPEAVVYDSKTDRIYQNIKTKNSLVVINPTTNRIEAQYSTLPATAPHGLVIDSGLGRAYVAGYNGKLVAIALASGHVLSESDIAPRTDQIAFDPKTQLVLCASRGFISVLKAEPAGLRHIADVPDHKGAHTIAVDSKRGEVWISYGDKQGAWLQSFRLFRAIRY